MNKHALIVGGAGFIGSQLAKVLLSSDYQVTVVDNFSRGKSEYLEKCITNTRFKLLNFNAAEGSQCENAFLPFNRNGVLFPQKINGKYAMLSRPSDNGHTPFGDIYISYSPDMKYWGEHRCVMKATPFEDSAWQCTKIGAGPIPILTNEGWLMLYHGVINTCNGFRYAMGSAILEEHAPDQVKYRTQPYLLGPAEPYEMVGDVPNVVFPCAALHDIEEDKLAIYYGAADTVVAMAFGKLSEVVQYTKENSL